MSRLVVTLVKSPIGNKPAARDTVRALGLRRLHQTVSLPDNASVRGMLQSVRHLVRWEDSDAEPAVAAKAPSIRVIPRAPQPPESGPVPAMEPGASPATTPPAGMTPTVDEALGATIEPVQVPGAIESTGTPVQTTPADVLPVADVGGAPAAEPLPNPRPVDEDIQA